mgnify:FL=1
MDPNSWGDSSGFDASNFEWTAPWLNGDSSAYGLNNLGQSDVSGSSIPNLDSSFQALDLWLFDNATSQMGYSITGSFNELSGDHFSSSSADDLSGQVSGVNQDIDPLDSTGRLDGLDTQDRSHSRDLLLGDWSRLQYDADYQSELQLAFERGFDKGYEKGLKHQPRSIVFNNVQFAGGFAENVAGNVIGGSINNLSPVFSSQWEMIEKSLINISDTLSFSDEFRGPDANFHKAYRVFKEIERDPYLHQEIFDFKGALRTNGLLHRSTNPVVNLVLDAFDR